MISLSSVFEVDSSIQSFIITICSALFLFISFLLFSSKNFSIQNLLGSKNRTLSAESDISEFEQYLNDVKISLLMLFTAYVIHLFVPSNFEHFSISSNVYLSIISILYSSVLFFSLLFLAHVMFSWQLKRKKRNTDSFLIVLMIISALIIIRNFLAEIIPEFRNDIFDSLYYIFLLAIFIFSYLFAGKNTWIALLDRDKKIRLAIYAFLQISFSVVLISSISSNPLSELLDFYFPGGEGLAFLICFISLPHYFRIFVNSVMTLPTTAVVERKNSELSSLTYLNKVVAETKDFSKITDVVTELAIRSTGAFASWTELNEDGKSKTVSLKNLTEKHVYAIDSIPQFNEMIHSFSRPFLIESIRKNQICKNIQKILPMANSMIGVPLYDKGERIGNLILLHIEDYGLEENDLKVLTAFSDNISIALENSRLIKESLENERFKNEMEIARNMQVKLLPQTLPEINKFTLHAFSNPAEVVGGDYYDAFKLADGRDCLLVGDVAGKGIGAAFFMAQVKGIAMSMAQHSSSGVELLENINMTLEGSIEKKSYITIGCLVIDNQKNRITYTRAGHMPLIHRKKDRVDFIKPKGLGIGLVPANKFNSTLEEIEIEVEENDMFVVFTDGINELRNTEGVEFGYSSLKFLLEKYDYSDAQNFNVKLKNSLENHCKDINQHDDMTVLTLMANKN